MKVQQVIKTRINNAKQCKIALKVNLNAPNKTLTEIATDHQAHFVTYLFPLNSQFVKCNKMLQLLNVSILQCTIIMDSKSVV